MTREEALNKIHKHVVNGLTDAFRIVNKIFDEHEAQLREAMKPKTCDGCKYASYDDECEEYYYSSDTYECRDCYRSGYKDNFMAKDN